MTKNTITLKSLYAKYWLQIVKNEEHKLVIPLAAIDADQRGAVIHSIRKGISKAKTNHVQLATGIVVENFNLRYESNLAPDRTVESLTIVLEPSSAKTLLALMSGSLSFDLEK